MRLNHQPAKVCITTQLSIGFLALGGGPWHGGFECCLPLAWPPLPSWMKLSPTSWKVPAGENYKPERHGECVTDPTPLMGIHLAAPPAHLQFAQGLIQKLVGHLQSSNPTSQVLPLQAFLCLYEDGEDACPNHVHDCRQLTLSLGADREVTVEGQRVMMRHGDILVLDGERHGVPAQKTKSSQSRVSINIFFTTSSDQTSRPVSVNHQAGKGYRNSTSEKGQGKGSLVSALEAINQDVDFEKSNSIW